MKRTTRPLGFTLIELLVVIAIIALLVSILVPSLQSARDLARKALCANNQKIVGLGVGFYAKEFNEYIPPTQYTCAAYTKYWPDMIAPFIDAECKVVETTKMVSVGTQPESGNYAGYWKNEVGTGVDCVCSKKFDCAGIPNRGKTGGPDWQKMWYEFHWNYYYIWMQRAWRYDEASANDPSNFTWVAKASRKPLQVNWFPNAAGFCIVYCNDVQKQEDRYPGTQKFWTYNNVSYFNSQALHVVAGMPHRATMNMLMLDGHVKSYDAASMMSWISPGPTKEPFDVNLTNSDRLWKFFTN